MEYLTVVLDAALFAVTPFLSALIVAFLFKTFVREEFPTWMGVLIGLALVGFDMGLADIAYAPTLQGILKFLFAMILAAWGCRLGNKFAEKFAKREVRSNGYHLLRRSFYKVSGKNFIEISMPAASDIQNLYGKKPVSNDLKRELGGKKFVEPADLPVEILEARIKRRLISDWRVGDAEVKLNEQGVVVKLALAAKKSRITSKIPAGKVLFSFKPESVPFELCYGDKIDIFVKNVEVRAVEVLNVEDGAILAVLDRSDAEKLAKKISWGVKPAVIAYQSDQKKEEPKQEKDSSKSKQENKK